MKMVCELGGLGLDKISLFNMKTSGLKLDTLINNLPSPNFTVIYTTTPSAGMGGLEDAYLTTSPSRQQETEEPPAYEMEEPLAYEVEKPYSYSSHLEMKRDLSAHPRAANSTRDTRPLFEKYQFFSPGRIRLRQCDVYLRPFR